MKKTFKTGLALLLTFLMIFSLAACGETNEKENADQNTSVTQAEGGLWSKALYTENKEFGTGNTTITLEVKVEDKSVSFTVKTDKEILGDALIEHKLIAGEEGPYGLFLKEVNGITADYDVDQSYWAFYKNNEMMMVGVDGAKIADGEHYELVYTK